MLGLQPVAMATLWILVLFVGAVYSAESPYGGSRCYDCNYAPSGHVKSSAGLGNDAGTLYCALQAHGDHAFIDQQPCKSGRCFIRQDTNGMVYRGCADEENLPWGVRAEQNCAHQGATQALWWFCGGDLCNNGQLGEDEDRCGDPPQDQGFVYGGEPEPQPSQHEDNPVHTQTYLDTDDHQTPSKVYRPNQESNPSINYLPPQQPEPETYQPPSKSTTYQPQPKMYHPEPKQDTHSYGYREGDSKSTDYGYDYYYPYEKTYNKASYNPCSGTCEGNPSGLYRDQGRPDHFIQCGAGIKGGQPCTCCQPFYLPCPVGTRFDDHRKVCSTSTSDH